MAPTRPLAPTSSRTRGGRLVRFVLGHGPAKGGESGEPSVVLRLFALCLVSVFVAEAVLMLVLEGPLSHLSLGLRVLADSALLSAAVSPVVYLFLVRPLIRTLRARRRAAREREQMIGALEEAVEEVKTLSGLLPLCPECRRVRNDKGYWQQIDEYFGQHHDTTLHESVCPSCAKGRGPEVNARSLP